jgi:tRNA pseudouridine55 synthase
MLPNFTEGKVILIDKPLTWTSFDVVKKLRYGLKVKKIGHAGTLDPLATGLLILCTGKMTKQIETYQAQEKEYIGTITLGSRTPSYDLETPVKTVADPSNLTKGEILAAVDRFTGEISQIPPAHSAIKVDGKRAYKNARAGKEQKLEPRQVTVSTFEITEIKLPEVSFRIVCSKGTYIRSLANDLGEALQVGGHLSSLRRTRIGEFLVADAVSPQEYLAHFSPGLHANS